MAACVLTPILHVGLRDNCRGPVTNVAPQHRVLLASLDSNATM